MLEIQYFLYLTLLVYFSFLVRLNNGPNSKSGGLEMYHNDEWFGVCDTDFGLNEARVACRSLKTEYKDARAIPGEFCIVFTNTKKYYVYRGALLNCSER